jgi:hypothetical protein
VLDGVLLVEGSEKQNGVEMVEGWRVWICLGSVRRQGLIDSDSHIKSGKHQQPSAWSERPGWGSSHGGNEQDQNEHEATTAARPN